MLPEIDALWIGPHLPARAAGCLSSFARVGHKVVLHTYANLTGVPKPIAVEDATATLPEARIFRRVGNGQLAVFADYFRYKLLRRRACIWVDCDVYCVRPLDLTGDCVFGRENGATINNAVLKLPAESPVLQDLVTLFEGRDRRPPWITPFDWLKTTIKSTLHGVPWVAAAPWGATGPEALTYLAAAHGIAGLAEAPDVFYPVPWDRAGEFATAGAEIALTPATRTIHLWNEIIRIRNAEPKPGSFLDRIAAEGAGGPPALVV